ncbi:MAG: hypothetical protein JWN06_3966 [Propionibacteriaceae bacterium]|jgi:hypothetical protein|nr:hypothetical protein [Propionibacteriaceae bacterium]
MMIIDADLTRCAEVIALIHDEIAVAPLEPSWPRVE